MKDKFYFKLSLNISAVFITVILLSYIPAKFPELFGDWFCEGRKWVPEHFDHTNTKIPGDTIGCDYGANVNSHNPTWHWGYQHWLWFAMGITLFVVQAFRIGEIINKKDK